MPESKTETIFRVVALLAVFVLIPLLAWVVWHFGHGVLIDP